MKPPFSNGSDYEHWCSTNCDRCSKYRCAFDPNQTDCEIALGLIISYVGDGTIPDDISKRMGCVDGRAPVTCGEFEPTERTLT